MPTSKSYKPISPEKLRAGCTVGIHRIEQYRVDADEANIEFTIHEASQPKWFGLVKGKVITREQAIKKLKKTHKDWLYGWESHRFENIENNLNNLIKFSTGSKSDLMLHSEDFSDIDFAFNLKYVD